MLCSKSKGDTLKTEYLVLGQQKGRIFSDQFVKIIQKDQVFTGVGFESNADFSEYRFKNLKGTFTSMLKINQDEPASRGWLFYFRQYFLRNELLLSQRTGSDSERQKHNVIFFSNLISLYTQYRDGLGRLCWLETTSRAGNLWYHLRTYFPIRFGKQYNWSRTDSLAANNYSTTIILATAEYLPKALFRINPKPDFKKYLPFRSPSFYFLFTRFRSPFQSLFWKFFWMRKIDKVDEKVVFSRIDLDHFVSGTRSQMF